MNTALQSLARLARGQPPPAFGAAPEEKPVLAVEQADLGYGRNVVLRNVSVQIHQGEFWCLLGPNGEGKSTFIKALLGAIRPLRGKIFLRPDFGNRTRLGFVPQECELNPTVPTTVNEFVSCGFVGLSLPGRVRVSRLKQILEMLGLTRLRTQSFWTLSGGQRQRCLIAAQRASHIAFFKSAKVTAGPLKEVFTEDHLSRTFGMPIALRPDSAGS